MEIKKEWLEAANKAVENSNKKNVIVFITKNNEFNILALDNTNVLIEAIDRNELVYRSGKLHKKLYKISGIHTSELKEESGFMNGFFVEHNIYVVKIIDLQ